MQLSSRSPALMLALVLLVLFAMRVQGANSPNWALARNAHFEVYSQDGQASARRALDGFEQLRAFFEHTGVLGVRLDPRNKTVVRVIGFHSATEYTDFRLHSNADAFYSSSSTADYIVLPSLAPQQFSFAAHEYAHFVLRANGLHLPVWLSEGLAEFFSTVHVTGSGCEFGGALPNRLAALQKGTLPPVARLVSIDEQRFFSETRSELESFYAESWALTNMLVSSPVYAPGFANLLAKLSAGVTASAALAQLYAKPLDALDHDLHVWLNSSHAMGEMITLSASLHSPVEVSTLSALQSDELLANLLLDSGQLEHAAALFHDLSRRHAQDPNVHAALGTIAMRRGDLSQARREWKQAIDDGIQDAMLCYRYATLADDSANDAGPSPDDTRAALQRAIAVKPDFDDARYQLALLESNAGNFAVAFEQLHAMALPAMPRAFCYWIATANALTELDRQEEAKAAADQALRVARTDDERAHARQMAYIAGTELVVQFETNAHGDRQLVTTRVPRGSDGFNPFVEPQDNVQRAQGTLREVRCAAGRLTGFVLKAQSGPLTLSVPDPTRVLMRNAPLEFTCGEQAPRSVAVEFAAQNNVLRGMRFIE